MYERCEVIEVPTISSQEGVEVVKSISQERLSERMCERSEDIDLPKISSHQENVEAVENIPQENFCTKV